MRYKNSKSAIALLLSLTGLANRAAAQDYELRKGEAVISIGGDFVNSPTHANCLFILGQPLSGRAANLDYSFDVGLLPICFPPPSTTNVFWNAGAGFWGTPGNWLPPVNPIGPTNGDNVTYAVYINNQNNDDVITLNTGPNITGLHITQAGAILQMNQNSGAASLGARLDPSSVTNATNAGLIRVVATVSNRLFTFDDMKLNQSATGVLEAVAANETPTAILRLTDSRVVGGVLRANGPGATVQIRNSSLPNDLDGGIFEAINGGTLDIGTGVGGGGLYSASGGLIFVRPGGGGSALSGSQVTVVEGGTLDIDGLGLTPYFATFTGDANLTAPDGPGWGSSPPVLNIGQRGRLTAHSINIFGEAGVNLLPGSVITLHGDWNNHSTSNGGEFNSEGGTIQVMGAPGGPTQTFELAGADFGLNAANGFTDNFALQRLEIGPGRHIRFQDTFSNSPPGILCGQASYVPETLYVHELVFGANSQITVDCGKVYYQSSAGSGTGVGVNLEDGGAIIYIGTPGDINGTGGATADDIPGFITTLMDGAIASPDQYFRSDLNHDGVVNGRDIHPFVDAVVP